MAETLPLIRTLALYQGATFRAAYRWLPGGVAQDFTGWTARMEVRPEYDADPVLTLTTDNGGITLGADGTISLYASAEQTSGVPHVGHRLLYDLALQQPNGGDVTRFLRGNVVVVREVTRL